MSDILGRRTSARRAPPWSATASGSDWRSAPPAAAPTRRSSAARPDAPGARTATVGLPPDNSAGTDGARGTHQRQRARPEALGERLRRARPSGRQRRRGVGVAHVRDERMRRRPPLGAKIRASAAGVERARAEAVHRLRRKRDELAGAQPRDRFVEPPLSGSATRTHAASLRAARAARARRGTPACRRPPPPGRRPRRGWPSRRTSAAPGCRRRAARRSR